MNLILQAIKSLLQKVEKRFDTVIPAPKYATVGQMIIVKAVDANGKPTEWEAVDPLTPGKALQLIEENYPAAEEVAF